MEPNPERAPRLERIVLIAMGVVLSSCTHLQPASSPSTQRPIPELQEIPSARILSFDASRKCQWIRSSSTVIGGGDDSYNALVVKALGKDKATAMQKVLGDQVWSSYISHVERTNRSSERLVIQELTVSQAGLILGEKNLREQKMDVQGCPECLRVQVKIDLCLAQKPPSPFSLVLNLGRKIYTEGERVTLTVQSGGSGYLYIYDVDPVSEQMTVLVPNLYVNVARVEADQAFHYPSLLASREGIELVARLSAGENSSWEILKAIVTRDPLPKTTWEPREKESWPNFLVRLIRDSKTRWAESEAMLVIVKETEKSGNIPLRTDLKN